MNVFNVSLKELYPFLGDDGKNPTVSVYLPEKLAFQSKTDGKRPGMVICPGGAYAIVSDNEFESIALKFLEMGFNVFVLTYSVAPKRYPSQLLEVAATFDYIHKNAEEFKCDLSKIGIIGFSAGGHLAAHYSNLWNDDIIKAHFGECHKPTLSILCYPVISTDFPHIGSFENLIGHFPENEEEIKRFSCEKLVGSQTPPTFLFHTAPDTTVPVQNSTCYANALASNGIPFELHIYPFGAHGISTADSLSNDNVDQKTAYTSDWMTRLKNWVKINFEI